ncbi:hypothetical protein JB92DRAFT_190540 [Gautieria morchelliformis]|nr:hypothetical protein JB92DRAFT_190540 [Gautieria morchelliformis]
MKTTAVVLAYAVLACCNTEIIKLSRFSALELPGNPSPTWPVLCTTQQCNPRTFEIHPVAWDEVRKNSSAPLPHDVWVVLEIDEWKQNTSLHDFTLRLSWAASMAVAFDISIFRPSAQQMLSNSAVGPTSSCYHHRIAQFNLVLEPLLWGAIPRSVMPTLLFLFAAIVVTSCMVPRIWLRLSQVAEAEGLMVIKNANEHLLQTHD